MNSHAAPHLSRSAVLILLALADQPRHGLGVIEEIESRTDRAVRMGPGTLYTMLKRLVDDGYIAETTEAPDPADHDPRRRYYQISGPGRMALRVEVEHMRNLVDVASAKRVIGAGS